MYESLGNTRSPPPKKLKIHPCNTRREFHFLEDDHMSDDAPRWASFSSAFSIVLSSASDRIAELGCDPVGDDPKAFVDRGGLHRLEAEAAETAIRRLREAAYPLIFKLFGSEMPRGKDRKLVLARLGQDLARIEKSLGYAARPALGKARERELAPVRKTRGKRLRSETA